MSSASIILKKFPHVISLEEIKKHPQLKKMQVARRGNRLSITPVTADEWGVILGKWRQQKKF